LQRCFFNPKLLEKPDVSHVVFQAGSASGARGRAKRSVPLQLEYLEDRSLLSASGFSSIPLLVAHETDASGPPAYSATESALMAFSPSAISQAYKFNQIAFNGVQGDGTGQTIAVIDSYNDPDFVSSTDPSFDTSALYQFDKQFGLPDPPSFTKITESGATVLTEANEIQLGGWGEETALDVEWAHALAPKANIVLEEAATSNLGDQLNVASEAAQLSGVSVVSMSFGLNELGTQTNFGETNLDSYLATPSGHSNVAFIASAGDQGQPTYPSVSPNVLAVGGTTLTVDSQGNYSGEVGWADGGGGVSAYEVQPSFQQGIVGLNLAQSTQMRTSPDVAFDANPGAAPGSTVGGIPIYATINDNQNAGTPWVRVGGTSFSAPAWASLVAIADQGRVLNGLQTLGAPLAGSSTGPNLLLPAIYSLPSSDFNAVTAGDNGYAAGPGYDFITGRGTPIANLVAAGLAQPATTDHLTVAAPAGTLNGAPLTISECIKLLWSGGRFLSRYDTLYEHGHRPRGCDARKLQLHGGRRGCAYFYGYLGDLRLSVAHRHGHGKRSGDRYGQYRCERGGRFRGHRRRPWRCTQCLGKQPIVILPDSLSIESDLEQSLA
jgi:subtilase family serine protease